MDFYQDLLDSFDKLKKRKLRLNERLGYKKISIEFPDIGNQVHAESERLFGAATPDDFINSSPNPNIPVGPPEEGRVTRDPTTGVYYIIDKEGRPQVIYSNLGKPDLIGWRRWATALAETLFAKQTMDQMAQAGGGEESGDTSGSGESEGGEESGDTSGSGDTISDTVGTEIDDMNDIPVTDLQAQLNRGKNSLVSIIERNPYFFQGDPHTVQWMASGLSGRYGNLRRRFFNAEHSVEDRFAKAYGLQDKGGFLTRVEISPEDQGKASDILVKFLHRLEIMATNPNSFSEEDIDWVRTHVVRDRQGVWFKDDHTLPYGIVLAWRFGAQEQHSNLWDNLVESYNKNLAQILEDRGIDEVPIIESRELREPNYTGNAGERSYFVGKAAEEIRPAILAYLNGDRETGAKLLSESLLIRTMGIDEKFAFLNFFKMDEMVGDEQTAQALKDAEDLSSVFKLNPLNMDSSEILKRVLKASIMLEKHSLAVRKPMSVINIGNVTKIGLKADSLETYNSDDAAYIALNNQGVPPEKIKDFIQPNSSVGESIKTRMYKNSKIQTGEASLDLVSKSILGDDAEGSFLVLELKKKLGIPEKNKADLTKAEEQLKLGRETIRKAFGNTRVLGVSPEEVKAQINSILSNFLINNAIYGELLDFQDLDKVMNQEQARLRLMTNLVRATEIQTILKHTKHDPKEMEGAEFTERARTSRTYRSLLALKACAASCSQKDVLLTVRAYEDMSSVTTSQNDIHLRVWKDFINGKAVLKTTGRNTMWVGYQAPNGYYDPKVKLEFTRSKQNNGISIKSYVTPAYLKENEYKPIQPEKPDTFVEQYMEMQRILLNRLLEKRVSSSK